MYFPGLNGRGGAEWLAVMTALELARMGWETCVFTDGPTPAELEADLGCDLSSISVVELGAPRPEQGRLRGLQRLRLLHDHASAIRRYGLDLFVNAKFKSQLPGCGRRNIYYCHFPHRLDLGATGALRVAYLGMLRAVERAAIDRDPRGFLATYDVVWTNSEFSASQVRQRWGVQPRVVYPPCDQVPSLDKRREIAVVGRFQAPGPNTPYKAQDFLLATFARMTDLHERGWRLVMIGGARSQDEAYLAGLRSIADHLPVDLEVNVSRGRVRGLLGHASLYWHAQGVGGDQQRFPETQEHFGISTVEAMSAGAIPLVYGTAGPLEVVGGVEGIDPWLRRRGAGVADPQLGDPRRRAVGRARSSGGPLPSPGR